MRLGELTKAAEATAAADDIDAQVLWRCVRAPIRLARARLMRLNAWYAQQLELALRTESPALQATSYHELAAVLQVARRPDEARQCAAYSHRHLCQERGRDVGRAPGGSSLATQ